MCKRTVEEAEHVDQVLHQQLWLNSMLKPLSLHLLITVGTLEDRIQSVCVRV